MRAPFVIPIPAPATNVGCPIARFSVEACGVDTCCAPFPKRLSEPFIQITNVKVRQPPKLCHPERSRGTCCAPFPQTTLRTLHPNNQRQGPPTLQTCHPERSRGTCCAPFPQTTPGALFPPTRCSSVPSRRNAFRPSRFPLCHLLFCATLWQTERHRFGKYTESRLAERRTAGPSAALGMTKFNGLANLDVGYLDGGFSESFGGKAYSGSLRMTFCGKFERQNQRLLGFPLSAQRS